jgi:hypothetical protein
MCKGKGFFLPQPPNKYMHYILCSVNMYICNIYIYELFLNITLNFLQMFTGKL